jgi:hypothetical protein
LKAPDLYTKQWLDANLAAKHQANNDRKNTNLLTEIDMAKSLRAGASLPTSRSNQYLIWMLILFLAEYFLHLNK